MKKLFLLMAAVICLAGCGKKTEVASPDGKLTLSLTMAENGVPTYAVCRDGKQVIAPSALGLHFRTIDLSCGLELTSTECGTKDETWVTTWGEEAEIRDHHNELIAHMQTADGHLLDVAFRVFDDGFAIRYILPEQEGMEALELLDEKTEYRFAEEPEGWSIPWNTAFYEALWTKAPLSQKDTMCSPLTLEMADGSYALVHEAALMDYPAENFYYADGALRTYLTPWLDKDSRVTDVKAYMAAPFATPWRMVILTRTLPEMVASRIMLNLNEPCAIEDTEWIRPMKFIGIWWGMHMKTMTWSIGEKHGATTENMQRYLQFAADHGFGGVLAEGWNTGWEGYEGIRPGERFSFVTPYPDYDIDSLARFAHRNGVEIVFHHETSGNADQYEVEMEDAFQYMEKYGMHSVKTGYVSHIITTLDGRQINKSQSGVRHYRKVIETAAAHHICIDNHEPVMPTGLQRTWPNLFTQEGIRGQEWNAWAADGGSPASHVCVLPFTRMMAGPADYTPGVFAFENPIIPGTRVHSTLMNQLGLFVCLYSPLQMACDLPENYMKHPDAFRFVEEVPCDWKRSILLDGKIGEWCVFARQDRASDSWWIGGVTNEEHESTMVLDMLEEGRTYTATIYRDGDNADWETAPYDYLIEEREVKAGDTLAIRMARGGGFAVAIK